LRRKTRESKARQSAERHTDNQLCLRGMGRDDFGKISSHRCRRVRRITSPVGVPVAGKIDCDE